MVVISLSDIKSSVNVARDSASDTTFRLPATCLMSVVNSAIKARCRDCHGDERSLEVNIAVVKGL